MPAVTLVPYSLGHLPDDETIVTSWRPCIEVRLSRVPVVGETILFREDHVTKAGVVTGVTHICQEDDGHPDATVDVKTLPPQGA